MSPPIAIMTNRLSPADEREIRIYLKVGGSIGARSCDGPMLDRLELYAKSTRPCVRCGGDIESGAIGTGTIFSDTPHGKRRRDEEYAYLSAVNESMHLGSPGVLELIGDMTCPDCDGRGWVIDERVRHDVKLCDITARPTGSSRDPWAGRAEPDPGTLATIGFVSRRLKAIGSPHTEVLLAYYLQTPVAETLRALWPLTVAGREMLKGLDELSPWQHVEKLKAKSGSRRATQFELANAEAERMLALACFAWRNAAGGNHG
jgi:hypothetical protein